MSPLETKMHKELFKAIVMRQIFDSDGNIADVRRSVLVTVTINGKVTSELMSSDKFYALPNLAETADQLPAGSTIEVWDGRALFGRAKSAGYVSYPIADSVPTDPNQEVFAL